MSPVARGRGSTRLHACNPRRAVCAHSLFPQAFIVCPAPSPAISALAPRRWHDHRRRRHRTPPSRAPPPLPPSPPLRSSLLAPCTHRHLPGSAHAAGARARTTELLTHATPTEMVARYCARRTPRRTHCVRCMCAACARKLYVRKPEISFLSNALVRTLRTLRSATHFTKLITGL